MAEKDPGAMFVLAQEAGRRRYKFKLAWGNRNELSGRTGRTWHILGLWFNP